MPDNADSENKASNAINKMQANCTDTVLFYANLFAIAMLVIGNILRFMHCFKTTEKEENGEKKMVAQFNLFFFVITLYMLAFIVLLLVGTFAAAGYFREKGFTQFVIKNFKAVDSKFGRGLFIIFVSFIMLEIPEAGEIVLAIICFIIALIDIVIGCREEEPLPSDAPATDKAGADFSEKPAASSN